MSTIHRDTTRPHARVRVMEGDALYAQLAAIEALCREMRTLQDPGMLLDGVRLLDRRIAEIRWALGL